MGTHVCIISFIGLDFDLRHSGLAGSRLELDFVHSLIDRSELDGVITDRINGVVIHG